MSTPSRIAAVAVALLLLAHAAGGYVDFDVYHLMALARATCELGRVPTDDLFAYTPTVHPTIQHEWGMGMVLYGAASCCGAAGLLVLRYGLTLGIALACAACARRRGASGPVLAALAPIGVLLVSPSLSTVRAQMLTLLFTAVLLLLLERDREGKRAWIAAWLAVLLVWVNVHGGFVVGLLFLLVHTAEQAAKRRPVRHLLLAFVASALVLGVTPYGYAHLPFLVRGILLARPHVGEWASMVHAAPLDAALFAGSFALASWAALAVGLRRAAGLPILVAAAAATAVHQRHLGIYAVVWSCLAPSWIERTAVGAALRNLFAKRALATSAVFAALALGAAASLARNRPFRLLVPTSPADGVGWTYPAGAVDYLRDARFRGHAMTPFHAGAFVAWKLHPDVLVSFDGRYEVAFPEGAEQENHDFFLARPGWKEILAKDSTDLVIAATSEPVADRMGEVPGWRLVYRDDGWTVWSRPGLELPIEDRRGRAIAASFP